MATKSADLESNSIDLESNSSDWKSHSIDGESDSIDMEINSIDKKIFSSGLESFPIEFIIVKAKRFLFRLTQRNPVNTEPIRRFLCQKSI